MGTMQYQRQLSSRVHASVCPEGSSGSLDSSIRNQGKKCRRLEASLRGHMRQLPSQLPSQLQQHPHVRQTWYQLVRQNANCAALMLSTAADHGSKKIVQQLAVASTTRMLLELISLLELVSLLHVLSLALE